MWYHYLKLAWRNLLKYKISAGIGVIGLAVGLLSFVFCNYCGRWIAGTDRDFPNYERMAEVTLKKGDKNLAGTPAWLVPHLQGGFPGVVECFSVVSYPVIANVTFENVNGKEQVRLLNLVETDLHFKDLFSVQLIAGTWELVSRQANAVVLSRTIAQQIYREQNPVGKILRLNDVPRSYLRGVLSQETLANMEYVVAGVMEDLPTNNSLSFLKPVDALFLNDRFGNLAFAEKVRDFTGCNTYALLYPDKRMDNLNQQVDSLRHGIFMFRELYTPVFQPIGQEYMERFTRMGEFYRGIGGLILLVALLNFFAFMNGNFLNRCREFYIRQGLGENRKQVFRSLCIEYLLLFFPVFILVGSLLEILHGSLNFSIRTLVFDFDPWLLWLQLLEYIGWGIVLCFVGCWFVSGQIVRKCRLYGKFATGKTERPILRNGVLAVQIFICFIFLTACLAVYLQFNVISNTLYPTLSREQKENIMEINLDMPQLKGREAYLIECFRQLPEVTEVLCTDEPILSRSGCRSAYIDGQYTEIVIRVADTNFLSFLNMPLLGGEMFHEAGQLIVDGELARRLGGEFLGKTLELNDDEPMSVCGWAQVLPQLYHESIRYSAWIMSEHPTCCYLKFLSGHRETALAKIHQIMKDNLPDDFPYRYRTLQEIIDDTDGIESQIKSMLLFFTIVCLLITILGIYSAITVDCARRRKEMAIRKINGASAWTIARLFASFYFRLLGVVIVIAFPLLWWGIQEWLSVYRFHFYYGFWFWVLVLGIMVVVITLTVVWKIREIIRMNPVDVLCDE